MTDIEGPSPGRVVAQLALAVVIGVPLVAYLWETVHQVLALRLEPSRLLLSLPVLGLFVALLVALGRRLGSEMGRNEVAAGREDQ